MSIITEMIIYTPQSEHEAMDRLNEWSEKADTERGQRFEQLDVSGAGGTKFFTGDIWAMAGNHYPYEKLLEKMPSFGWTYPEDVVLIFNHENEETYTYRIVEEDSNA